ncbi:MAG: hypothetical protein KKD48_05270 [Nanoarchaeota archaeon]|nr:hypothetical protein [Nanoarchaeota archaeon]
MVARKRLETEDYKKYKENLKEEAELLKYYLKGRIWWQSFHRGQFIKGDYIQGRHGKIRKYEG